MICNCAFINTNKTTYKKRLRFQDGCALDSVLISNLAGPHLKKLVIRTRRIQTRKQIRQDTLKQRHVFS